MFLFRLFFALNFTITLIASGANGYGPLSGYARPGAQQGAMDTYGLDPKLASILGKYYKNNFTSERDWEALKSIQYEGVLHLSEGELRFKAFKKKPYLCKIVIFGTNGTRIEMGYDGEDAWQSNARSAESPFFTMNEAEGSNFIRDATIGGHLLFPLINEKKIELLGPVDVDGARCYEIQITLPDGQVISSFLHVSDFTENRRVTINQVSGLQEVTTNSDFRKIGSLLIPFRSVLVANEVQVHEIIITEAKANQGTMNWMFARPRSNSAGMAASAPSNTLKSTTTSKESKTGKPLNSTFGSYFGADSVFDVSMEDYKSGQIDTILRNAGVPIPAKN